MHDKGNRTMKLTTSFFVTALLVLGCDVKNASQSVVPNPSPITTTQPALQAIELRSGIYLARLEVHVTITPDGLMRYVRTENDHAAEVRQGRLTSRQMSDLAALFT